MDVQNRLAAGNRHYVLEGNAALRQETAKNGQHPYAIVVCCSDSRVIPEEIFSASLGELFVIRVAGNVLDRHQLGSIEYAAAHLHVKLVVVMGHSDCGAVNAALHGEGSGFISYITEDILKTIGEERDPGKAARLHVQSGVERIRREFADHEEIGSIEVRGTVYELASGKVTWL